ncbi:MAG: VWA domain-containing protein [Clostridiales bacterium]|nr:VWA domain-containing protein [Clostridiales bacterium]
MKKGLTELVFILDRSGSMSGLETDTIGGYNSMLAKQKNEPGEAVITTVLFDDKYELLHDRISLKGIAPITDREYFVRGSTALLDAIGRTINKIGNAQKNTLDEERAEKIMFVITTDGMENASREYGYDKVRRMIERQKERYGWEFIFLGANIDAVETAARFGINADRAVNYNSDSEGTQLNYEVISETVSCMRASQAVPSNWKQRIDEDYKRRGKK